MGWWTSKSMKFTMRGKLRGSFQRRRGCQQLIALPWKQMHLLLTCGADTVRDQSFEMDMSFWCSVDGLSSPTNTSHTRPWPHECHPENVACRMQTITSFSLPKISLKTPIPIATNHKGHDIMKSQWQQYIHKSKAQTCHTVEMPDPHVGTGSSRCSTHQSMSREWPVHLGILCHWCRCLLTDNLNKALKMANRTKCQYHSIILSSQDQMDPLCGN